MTAVRMTAGAWPDFAPAGIVFDLDGLLLDTEEAWGRAERAVVVHFGAVWEEAIRTRMLGRGPREAARLLAEFVNGARVNRSLPAAATEEVGQLLRAEALSEFAAGVALRPGAAELLAHMDGALPQAIATSTPRDLATVAIAGAGLADRFSVVVCADDVAATKPAPDPYLIACRRLGVDPATAVAFEDSPVGVTAAKAAGMWVIGCPSVPGQVLTHADAVIDSLVGLRLPALHA